MSTLFQKNTSWRFGRILSRKQWLVLHTYLGLWVGAVFAVISLSGSLIVFATQLDTLLNADKMQVQLPNAPAQMHTAEALLAAAKSAIPANGQFTYRIGLPQQAADVFEISYRIPPALDSYQIFVNPYTAEVLGQRLWGGFDRCCSWHGPLMAMIYRLHDSLWLGEIGSIIVGSIALFMLLALLAGSVLWWPKRGQWRKALRFKRHACKQRMTYDLHKILGVYSIVLLSILLCTGAYLSLQVPFPHAIAQMLGVFSPLTETPKQFNSQRIAGQAQLSISQVIDKSTQIFPAGVITSIMLPASEVGVYKIFKHEGNKILFPSRQKMLVLDAYSGDVIYKTDSNALTAGDVFVEWQLALHSGEAFGVTGQIIVLLVGCVPCGLYITGFIRWRQKCKVRQTQ